ncbi:MAG TPA: ABC transporter permease subunit [Gemmatales bacterium]|nr:ABC transporter permease subunit [Gemmatales bacterium]
MFYAWWYLVKLSFWRQGRSLQTLTAFLLVALLAGIVVLVSVVNTSLGRPGWNVGNFTRDLIVGRDNVPGIYFNLLMPLMCLCFGTQALGGEWEERSLVWILTRPIPRWLIYLAKFTAALPWTLLSTVGGFWLAGWAVGSRTVDFRWHEQIVERLPQFGPFTVPSLLPELLVPGTVQPMTFWPGLEVVRVLWPCVLAGSVAYLALFMLLGAVFRRSTAYAFLLEGLVGTMPGLLKRASLAFYTRCMAYDWAAWKSWPTATGNLGIDPSKASLVLPVPGVLALAVLILVTGLLLLVGAWWFSRKEYHDLS